MKHYLDLKGKLICGDILTDASKETFYRFLHYDENTAFFNSVQCEKLMPISTLSNTLVTFYLRGKIDTYNMLILHLQRSL